MNRIVRKFALVALLVGTTALVGSATPSIADDAIVEANLTGAAERPGPGDPDATGRAVIYIDDDTNRLCLSLRWAAVDGTLSGLHIHFGPATAPGPVVVPFAVPPTAATGSTFQCLVVANEELLDNIGANPAQYYINLHSTPNFGPGAIRGQLF